jgi:hypothetical protein
VNGKPLCNVLEILIKTLDFGPEKSWGTTKTPLKKFLIGKNFGMA